MISPAGGPGDPTVNLPFKGLESAARVVFQAALGDAAPVNDGVFRRLSVVCDPGTVVSPEPPAPTSLYYEAMSYAIDLMQKTLAPVVPDRLSAGNYLSACAETISGIHPETGVLFILYEPNPEAGAPAAGMMAHGRSSTSPMATLGRFPSRSLRPGSDWSLSNTGSTTAGGAGEWRGGEGVVREYSITSDRATLTAAFGRSFEPPWGVDGGRPGSVNECTVIHVDGAPPPPRA